MTCDCCGERRDPIDLLKVTHRPTGTIRYICRPGLGTWCFAKGVRLPRVIESIELAA